MNEEKCLTDGCGQDLEVVYENNGFNPPDPTHWDSYLVCPVHGEVNNNINNNEEK